MSFDRDAVCPVCGFAYKKMRTGLTYQAVFDMLKDNSDDPADWKYKRRGTVLGYWHSLKREWWELHLIECEKSAEFEQQLAAVPF